MSNISTHHWEWNRWNCPRVQGRCRACGCKALFLSHGGWVTCANLSCPDPEVANRDLHMYESALEGWAARNGYTIDKGVGDE